MREWVKVVGLAAFAVLLATCFAVACGGGEEEEEQPERTPAATEEGTPFPEDEVDDAAERQRYAQEFCETLRRHAESFQGLTEPQETPAATATKVATPTATPTEGTAEDALEVEQYFRRVEEIRMRAAQSLESVLEEGREVGEDPEAARDWLARLEAVDRQAVNDIGDLDPPTEVRDAHDELVAALWAGLAVFEEFSARAADVETFSELEALYAEFAPALEEWREPVNKAWCRLEGIADEHGIQVDLACEYRS